MTGRLKLPTYALLACMFASLARGQETASSEQTDGTGVQLSYQVADEPIIYEIAVEADFGSSRYNRKAKVNGEYKMEETPQGEFQIKTQRMRTLSRNPYSGEHEFFKIGPFSIFAYGTDCSLDAQGNLIKARQAEWLCALPFDIGRLPFPELSDEQQWKIEETVALVRNARYSRYLQLLPLSPKISPGRDRLAYGRNRLNQDPGEITVAIATTTRQLSEQTEDQVTISETYSLDGTDFDTQAFVSGEGTIQFSKADRLVQKIEREYRVKMKSPNREMTVPVSVSVTRLTGEALAAYQDEQEKSRQAQLDAKQKTEAMEAALPETSDRPAVMEVVANAEDDQFLMLVRKLDQEEVKDDVALARALYARHVRRGRLDYTTKKVIIRLDPSLERTVELADKYAIGSVDVSVLGDLLSPDTKLTADQMIFYQPYSSSWTFGRFYGAVKDVVVLLSRDREPKLIAVKRDRCRLPIAGFWDPKTQDEP